MTDTANSISALIAPHVGTVGGLITALRQIQEAFAHIPADAIASAAELFNLSKAEIRGVVSFYEDFRDQPLGKTLVRVCRAEACQAVGARGCEERASAALGVSMGKTRADGAVSLLPVYCLGLCASGPAIMVDGKAYGRAEGERLDALLAGCGK